MNQIFESLLNWDHRFFILINSTFNHPTLDQFFPFITDLYKKPWFIGPTFILFLFLFCRRYSVKKGHSLFFLLLLNLAATDLIGNHLLKKNFERLRPPDANVSPVVVRSPYGGFSFISNHAANMMSFTHFTGYFLPYTRLFLCTATALVSYSRIYNGVHFPIDVIGGLILGFLVSSIFIYLTKKIKVLK